MLALVLTTASRVRRCYKVVIDWAARYLELFLVQQGLITEKDLGDEQVEHGGAEEREALGVANLVAVFYAWAANTAVRQHREHDISAEAG